METLVYLLHGLLAWLISSGECACLSECTVDTVTVKEPLQLFTLLIMRARYNGLPLCCWGHVQVKQDALTNNTHSGRMLDAAIEWQTSLNVLCGFWKVLPCSVTCSRQQTDRKGLNTVGETVKAPSRLVNTLYMEHCAGCHSRFHLQLLCFYVNLDVSVSSALVNRLEKLFCTAQWCPSFYSQVMHFSPVMHRCKFSQW